MSVFSFNSQPQSSSGVLKAILSLAVTTTIGFTVTQGAAQAITVTFDDLVGQELVPDGYGGIRWDSNWTYYDFEQEPYNPQSQPNRIYTNYSKWPAGNQDDVPFYFYSPVVFDGAYFSGLESEGSVNFNLYNGGSLVATSATLLPTSTPTFLSSGYSGLVDEVRIVGTNGYYVADDVTYNSTSVPEPSIIIGTSTALAFGAFLKRKTAKPKLKLKKALN